MRRLWVALAACSLLAACADDATPRSGPDPAPTGTASPTPADDPLAEASCENRRGGDPSNTPDFTDVQIGSGPEDATETIEFVFEPKGRATDAPQWFAGFVDELITDGEGAPVEVEGEAFLSVSFMARGVDLSGETFEPIYKGPTEFTDTGLTTVLEVEQTGDFEGLVSWGIGLSHEACFVVEEHPDRLALVFPVTP